MPTVNSFVKFGKKLLSTHGVRALFSERFNQDPLESFFAEQRQHGGYRENPTVQDFICGTQSLRVQGSLAKDPIRGNSCYSNAEGNKSSMAPHSPSEGAVQVQRSSDYYNSVH